MKNNVALLWLHFAMASLCNDMTSLCNGYVAFKTVKDVCFRFHFSRSPMFTNKATILLDDGLYRKISALPQVLLNQ